ncbi:hypothetical protein QEH59_17690 [Coraliomargarita sp. SDUM461004]|uniref:Uncharacterized protein n=1 Tax=Thalassobacterium sedimentorum TaxID=3041258 RepID=A0ABU1ANA6_9BACT|nr:hypothetical protein [Coraliomargarita sp. SDUM461004]MDQ8196272.1 hypothetical protein [Coraliomargarita sp. SDUM461004]
MQKNVPHIENLLSKLYNLNRDRGSGWEKPYKPALRLALIDLIEQSTSPACPEPVDRLEGRKELLKLEGQQRPAAQRKTLLARRGGTAMALGAATGIKE